MPPAAEPSLEPAEAKDSGKTEASSADVGAIVSQVMVAFAKAQAASAKPRRKKKPGAFQGVPVQKLVKQMMQLKTTDDLKFHLVVVPEEKDPFIATFDTADDLVIEIQRHLGADAAIFPFLGHALKISKGEHKFLKTPFGTLPLFVMPKEEDLEFDDSGWVGKRPRDIGVPRSPDAPEDPNAAPDDEDEEAIVVPDGDFATRPSEDEDEEGSLLPG